MSALLRLSGGIDRLNTALGRLAAVFVLLAALISAGNAVLRYALSQSSNARLEIQWYLFAAIVMLGAAETLRRNEHVRVDLIYAALSDRARLWVDVGGIVLFLLPFCGLMAWLCGPVAWRAFGNGEMSASAGGLVRWPVRAVIAAGFGLLFLQGLSELVKRVAALRGHVALDTAYEKPQQ